jgi:hypothetical protein
MTLGIYPPTYDYEKIDIYYNLPGIRFIDVAPGRLAGFQWLAFDNYKGANLKFADFSYHHLFGINFSYADLFGAIFNNPPQIWTSSYPKQRLVEVNFSHSNLEKVNLSGSEYYGVNIEGALTKDATFNFDPAEAQVGFLAGKEVKKDAASEGFTLNNVDDEGNSKPGLFNGTAEAVFETTEAPGLEKNNKIHTLKDVTFFSAPPSSSKQKTFNPKEIKDEMRSTLFLYKNIKKQEIPEKATAIQNLIDTLDNNPNKSYEENIEAWKKNKLSNTSSETNWDTCRKRANPNYDALCNLLPGPDKLPKTEEFIEKTLEISKVMSASKT